MEKILFICRVFSGFEVMLETKAWAPSGAPTIFKMMERLDLNNAASFVLTDYKSPKKTKDFSVSLCGLKARILVVVNNFYLPSFLRGLRFYINQIRIVFKIVRIVLNDKPSLVYVDKNNLIVGAILARFLSRKVLLRIMGIYPAMWDLLGSSRVWDRIQRYAYRSPFSAVICTKDGTAGDEWMRLALSPPVERHLLLNGVDEELLKIKYIKNKEQDSSKKLKVLFLGRLEENKGIREFIKGMLIFMSQENHNVSVLVVGKGSLKSEIMNMIGRSGFKESFKLIQDVPHSDILRIRNECDIYVSLNRLGNLSNANLEAFAIGSCMVIPSSNEHFMADKDTDLLINDASVLRIENKDISRGLADAIYYLTKNPKKREELGLNLYSSARSFLYSWDHRIDIEMDIILRIQRA